MILLLEESLVEVVLSTGDRAPADDDEHALYVARTLVRDYWDAQPHQGRGKDLTVTFLVAGQHVQTIDARRLP
jgi:hypothetical protein